jgi:CRISPR-associated protein Cas2
MRKFNAIICYDISNKQRLSKIAKFLEQHTIRIQLSVFFYPECSKDDIVFIINEILNIIDKDEDDVRIYKVDIKKSININNATNLSNPQIEV